MSSLPPVETIEAHGCSIVLRRLAGPQATELYLSCQPPTDATDIDAQAAAIYRALLSVLEAEGSGYGAVVAETVFLRNPAADIESVRESRQRVLEAGGAPFSPAITELQQPPLGERGSLEVLIQAVLPSESPSRFELIEARPTCACDECARTRGLRVHLGAASRFFAGGIYGAGEDSYQQSVSMFEAAEARLQEAGRVLSAVWGSWL